MKPKYKRSFPPSLLITVAVIVRTFPSTSEAPVDERQLAMARVLLAYAAAWAPAPAALAQLRESVAEYKAAVQGSPAPLIQFVDMFVQVRSVCGGAGGIPCLDDHE